MLIAQIIQNLVINADDAMINGGNIEISTKEIEIENGNEFSLTQGKYIKIGVKDFGEGIAEDVQDHIFNLFFTTKPSGNGIGLSLSRNIAKNHNGALNFNTEIGKGTEFYLYLPKLEKLQ